MNCQWIGCGKPLAPHENGRCTRKFCDSTCRGAHHKEQREQREREEALARPKVPPPATSEILAKIESLLVSRSAGFYAESSKELLILWHQRRCELAGTPITEPTKAEPYVVTTERSSPRRQPRRSTPLKVVNGGKVEVFASSAVFNRKRVAA